MRCTNSLCQSANTRRIGKTLKLHYEDDKIVDAHITELWLCNNCGNPFAPATKKVEPWHLRLGMRKQKYIPKTQIVKELFK